MQKARFIEDCRCCHLIGRQTSAIDAAGLTTFLYDRYGQLTNEIVISIAAHYEYAPFGEVPAN